MEYRAVGSSNLVVSALGLGCSGFGTRIDMTTAEWIVRAALDHGVTLFDTADVYGKGASEEALGRALGERRDEAIVATKFRWPVGNGDHGGGTGRAHIRAAVEQSLRRLGTDRIDLYQIHAPDPQTPIEETLAALDELAASGKIRYAGSSNFEGWRVVDADWSARTGGFRRLVSTQAPFSLVDLGAERHILPATRHTGVGFIACLVLARGFLAGSFGTATDPAALGARKGVYLTPLNARRRELIERFAFDHGLGLADVAIVGVLARPGVCAALVGASTVEQIASNAAAADFTPPGTDLSRLLTDIRNLDEAR